MSDPADRRWEQRRFVIQESTATNNGARTIFVETMTPRTSVPPHYHSNFSETFDLVRGSIKIYHAPRPDLEALETSACALPVGEPQTIKPGIFHKYSVGEEVTTLRVTLTPGSLDFERLLKILDGLAGIEELEASSEDIVMLAIVMELADARCIGPVGETLKALYKTKAEEVAARKEKLLRRFDTDEGMERLMENARN